MPTKAQLLKGVVNVLEDAYEASKAGKLEEALAAKQAPSTTPRGGRLFPDVQMYTPDVPQVDLPRMPKVDKARAEGKKPSYTPRMQDLLDSPTVRKKVDKLIDKGAALNMTEWYGTEPLRQAAMEAGVTPEQYRSFMAQLASASQRNPVDQQNLMGSYLYHLQQAGQLPENAMLLTNKLAKALKSDPSLAEGRTLIQFPPGYGSLAQGDIFDRGAQIAKGDIEGALPPEAKLGTFYRNLLGNLRPVTVDVNAVRGPVIEQGDPRWLTSKLVEKDTEGNVTNTYFPRRMVEEGDMSVREAKQRPGFWEAAPSGSEYAGFEDLWQRAARRHGVEPAEAQALGWYGSGDVTALKTKPELYIDNLERLIRRTADIEGENPLQTMERILRGETYLKKAKGGGIEANAGRGMAGLTRSKQDVNPKDVQAMFLELAASQGMPFAEAGAEYLRGNLEDAKSSAAIDAALTAVPVVSMAAKPVARAVKRAMPVTKELLHDAFNAAQEAGLIQGPAYAVPQGKKIIAAPQDEALRTAQERAVKMLGLPPSNTPMDRAKAMGYDTLAYHGTDADFPSFDIAKRGTATDEGWYGPGEYSAPYPETANAYAMTSWPNYKENANVLKVLLKNPEVIKNQFGYVSEYVTRNPNQVRSKHAAFDPSRIDENDLLAGLAALGIGLPALSLSTDKDYD